MSESIAANNCFGNAYGVPIDSNKPKLKLK